jgi:hypothetical protein
MRELKINFVISCIFIMLCFLTFNFAQIAQADQTPEELNADNTRIKQCLNCCEIKQMNCYNIVADRRLCQAELENCFATCRTMGKDASEWSECWSGSANK